jgi:hypothetical protein
VDIPFIVGALEGFETTCKGGDFWGHFWRGTGAATSSPEADEPESNKSNAWAGAQTKPPPPVEVEDVLPLLILTFLEEVFSMMLSPEDCELNFQLAFKGLASANFWAEV